MISRISCMERAEEKGGEESRPKRKKINAFLPWYVVCTVGILCFFAYVSAFLRSRAATAAIIISECDLAGLIKAIGLEM